MNRASFLRRMAVAALASGFIDVERLLPKIESVPEAVLVSPTFTAAEDFVVQYAYIYNDVTGEVYGTMDFTEEDKMLLKPS